MPIMIQTAGFKTKGRPWILGPSAPENAVVLNARSLPNPYGKVPNYAENRMELIKAFLLEKAPDKVERLVKRGVAAIDAKKPLVIVCMYGKDRSRAIAELVGARFHPSKVYYVHREN